MSLNLTSLSLCPTWQTKGWLMDLFTCTSVGLGLPRLLRVFEILPCPLYLGWNMCSEISADLPQAAHDPNVSQLLLASSGSCSWLGLNDPSHLMLCASGLPAVWFSLAFFVRASLVANYGGLLRTPCCRLVMSLLIPTIPPLFPHSFFARVRLMCLGLEFELIWVELWPYLPGEVFVVLSGR